MSDTTSVDPVKRKPRPLSPHLMIYRPIPTMVMSILHRITGVGLYLASVLVAWWLIATAVGPAWFAPMAAFFESWIGVLGLFVLSWVLLHHMLGGLKHLMQDTGTGLQRDFTTALAYAHIIASLALTVLLWFVGALVN